MLMARDAMLVLTDLPTGAGWEYGGFSYGLEPLSLPPPGAPDAVPEHSMSGSGRVSGYDETCRELGRMSENGAGAVRVERCDGDQLYWFRWITGHQVSFVLWRLLAQLMNEFSELGRVPDSGRAAVCHYVHGYSTMLLYTGSCTRATYRNLIRPSMRLRHPAFSGSWAPDYVSVRDLFRARTPAFMRSEDVLRAVRLHQLVHTGIAAKLVPDGRSLLQQSDVRVQDMRLMHAIYDNYFMTLRATVSRHEVVAQLLRRLVAIAQDVTVNGLTLADDERSPELCEPEVRRCERDFGAVLTRIAACAAADVPMRAAGP